MIIASTESTSYSPAHLCYLYAEKGSTQRSFALYTASHQSVLTDFAVLKLTEGNLPGSVVLCYLWFYASLGSAYTQEADIVSQSAALSSHGYQS